MATNIGWRRNKNAASGVEALELSTGDTSRSPYVFGIGVTDTGRISTGTRAGATIEFPTGYGFGEALELRYRSTFSASQFQGIYLQVRQDVANTSTVRGMEIEARQGGAVAIGSLIGLTATANVASTTTGTVTTVIGLDAQTTFNSSAYTGTVTSLYGLRVKCAIEDGATITTGYSIYVETEAVTGAPTGTARMDAILGVATSPAAGVGYWRYGIDTSGTEFTNGSGNEVVLWKFIGANGTTYYVVHDTDSATALGVVTTDPTT